MESVPQVITPPQHSQARSMNDLKPLLPSDPPATDGAMKEQPSAAIALPDTQHAAAGAGEQAPSQRQQQQEEGVSTQADRVNLGSRSAVAVAPSANGEPAGGSSSTTSTGSSSSSSGGGGTLIDASQYERLSADMEDDAAINAEPLSLDYSKGTPLCANCVPSLGVW